MTVIQMKHVEITHLNIIRWLKFDSRMEQIFPLFAMLQKSIDTAFLCCMHILKKIFGD